MTAPQGWRTGPNPRLRRREAAEPDAAAGFVHRGWRAPSSQSGDLLGPLPLTRRKLRSNPPKRSRTTAGTAVETAELAPRVYWPATSALGAPLEPAGRHGLLVGLDGQEAVPEAEGLGHECAPAIYGGHGVLARRPGRASDVH